VCTLQEVDAESIHSLGDDHFHVQLATDSSWKYLVDLGNHSCDCPDWPKVQLCKHISAVGHFFGHNDLQIVAVSPKTLPPNGEVSPDVRSDGAVATTTNLENVINVSREVLSDGLPSSTETVRSLQAVEAHLTAVVHSTCSSESPLPDQEQIPPNQRGSMWAETAKRMGITQGRKRSQATTPEPPSSVHIGDINRKQARVKITDPYSGGVSSSQAAAPDARSAAKNAEARARAAPTAKGTGALSTPAPSTPHFTWYPPGVQAPALIPMPMGPSSNPLPPTSYPPTPGMYVHAPYVHAPYHSGYLPYWPYTYFPPPPPPCS
jgi:hypothetical protein